MRPATFAITLLLCAPCVAQVDMELHLLSPEPVQFGEIVAIDLIVFSDTPLEISAIVCALEWDASNLLLVHHITDDLALSGFPLPPDENPCTLANETFGDGDALYVTLPQLPLIATPEGKRVVTFFFMTLSTGPVSVDIPDELNIERAPCDFTVTYFSTGFDVTGFLGGVEFEVVPEEPIRASDELNPDRDVRAISPVEPDSPLRANVNL